MERTAEFYIGKRLIETFKFNPEDIPVLPSKELFKHSDIINPDTFIISEILYSMIDDDMTELIYPGKVYGTGDLLKIVIK